MTTKAEFQDLEKLLKPYYSSGLVWETDGTKLLVHWGHTRCIGLVYEVIGLSPETINTLLGIWFEEKYLANPVEWWNFK